MAGVSDDAVPGAPAWAAASVDVLVAAYNERRHIGARIDNLGRTQGLDVPLGIRVGSDGSDDGTVPRANEAAQRVRAAADPSRPPIDVEVIAFEPRRGKPSVMNDLVARSRADVVVFTDANTRFAPDTIERLLVRFADPAVGCVCGELRLVAKGGAENRDHVYWRYERFLKYQESQLDALLGANGGVYAIRRELYEPVPANTVVDDFWISMSLIERGWRCVYAPEAVAVEDVPARIADEFGRRVRIGVGNYQALRRFAGLLNPRRGTLALAFFSHKVLRWFVPHLMLVALACNVTLAALVEQPFYAWLLLAQLLFYGAAWIGHAASRRGGTPAPLRLPLFLVSMNLALLFGWWRYLSGRFGGTWARTAR